MAALSLPFVAPASDDVPVTTTLMHALPTFSSVTVVILSVVYTSEKDDLNMSSIKVKNKIVEGVNNPKYHVNITPSPLHQNSQITSVFFLFPRQFQLNMEVQSVSDSEGSNMNASRIKDLLHQAGHCLHVDLLLLWVLADPATGLICPVPRCHMSQLRPVQDGG